MASGWGKRVRVAQQKWVTNNTPGSSPTTWYASLHTGNPGDDGQTANEVTTTTSGYARQSVAWTAITAHSSLSNDDASIASNSGGLSFGPSTGANAAWGAITYVGVWEHVSTATEAVYLGRAAASVSQSVGGSGVTITVAAAGLQMSLDSV